jgi:hypothetical protein
MAMLLLRIGLPHIRYRCLGYTEPLGDLVHLQAGVGEEYNPGAIDGSGRFLALADIGFEHLLFVLGELDDEAFPWQMISFQR